MVFLCMYRACMQCLMSETIKRFFTVQWGQTVIDFGLWQYLKVVTIHQYYSPYSKIAASGSFLLFDCKLAHLASLSNVKFKEYFTLNEAKRANLQSNKRILK